MLCCLRLQIHPPDPRIDNILYISFDRSFLTGIRPLPPREAAMRVSRLPKVTAEPSRWQPSKTQRPQPAHVGTHTPCTE